MWRTKKEKGEGRSRKKKGEGRTGTEALVVLAGLGVIKTEVKELGEVAMGAKRPREAATGARRPRETATGAEKPREAVIVREKRPASLSLPASFLSLAFLSLSVFLASKRAFFSIF